MNGPFDPEWNLPLRFSQAYFELGDLKRAEADYDKIFTKAPNQPLANYYLARVFDKKGQVKESLFFYQRYLCLVGDTADHVAEVQKAISRLQK